MKLNVVCELTMTVSDNDHDLNQVIEGAESYNKKAVKNLLKALKQQLPRGARINAVDWEGEVIYEEQP